MVDQVVVVRVPLDPPGDEWADRDGLLAPGPHVVQGGPGQRPADALALEAIVHLGVGEHGAPVAAAVLGEPGQLTAQPGLVALPLGGLDDLDGGRTRRGAHTDLKGTGSRTIPPRFGIEW